jgi:hypothetical protein
VPGIVTAWLVGEGIIFWRSWRNNHSFPVPGQLVAASFIFILLGLLAESEKARPLATTMAWGFDIAALLNLLPQVATGGTNTGPNPVTGNGAAPGNAGTTYQQLVSKTGGNPIQFTGGTVQGGHGR